jgi:DNA polymerase III delta subunit
VDVKELAKIEAESKNQGLFGPSCCYALVRNAQSANPKQTEHLLRLARSVLPDNRLIICAAGIDWKKALHKKMKAESALSQCEFHMPDEAGFRRWLQEEIRKSGLNISPDVLSWMSERLCGMRMAARQFIERLAWYDGGTGEALTLEVIGELLGERAPDALEDWCHAVARRNAGALGLTRRLLYDQHLTEVQMLSWLGTRLQQILMYRWHQSRQASNPLQAAKVFGAARQKVAEESRCWSGAELSMAVNRIVAAEKLIKGASVEDNPVVIERLVLDLIAKDRLAA